MFLLNQGSLKLRNLLLSSFYMVELFHCLKYIRIGICPSKSDNIWRYIFLFPYLLYATADSHKYISVFQ